MAAIKGREVIIGKTILITRRPASAPLRCSTEEEKNGLKAIAK